MFELICDLLEALRVPRCEKHHGRGIADEHSYEGIKKKSLFAVHGASANQDWACR